jgi:xylose isomerase
METLAMFARFLLTITPPLPPDDQAALQAKGQQRYEGFVEALGRRLQKGQSFLNEIPDDVDKKPSDGARDDGKGSAS